MTDRQARQESRHHRFTFLLILKNNFQQENAKTFFTDNNININATNINVLLKSSH
jgi:hypothetical protein